MPTVLMTPEQLDRLEKIINNTIANRSSQDKEAVAARKYNTCRELAVSGIKASVKNELNEEIPQDIPKLKKEDNSYDLGELNKFGLLLSSVHSNPDQKMISKPAEVFLNYGNMNGYANLPFELIKSMMHYDDIKGFFNALTMGNQIKFLKAVGLHKTKIENLSETLMPTLTNDTKQEVTRNKDGSIHHTIKYSISSISFIGKEIFKTQPLEENKPLISLELKIHIPAQQVEGSSTIKVESCQLVINEPKEDLLDSVIVKAALKNKSFDLNQVEAEEIVRPLTIIHTNYLGANSTKIRKVLENLTETAQNEALEQLKQSTFQDIVDGNFGRFISDTKKLFSEVHDSDQKLRAISNYQQNWAKSEFLSSKIKDKINEIIKELIKEHLQKTVENLFKLAPAVSLRELERGKIGDTKSSISTINADKIIKETKETINTYSKEFSGKLATSDDLTSEFKEAINTVATAVSIDLMQEAQQQAESLLIQSNIKPDAAFELCKTIDCIEAINVSSLNAEKNTAKGKIKEVIYTLSERQNRKAIIESSKMFSLVKQALRSNKSSLEDVLQEKGKTPDQFYEDLQSIINNFINCQTDRNKFTKDAAEFIKMNKPTWKDYFSIHFFTSIQKSQQIKALQKLCDLTKASIFAFELKINKLSDINAPKIIPTFTNIGKSLGVSSEEEPISPTKKVQKSKPILSTKEKLIPFEKAHWLDFRNIKRIDFTKKPEENPPNNSLPSNLGQNPT